SNSIRLGQFFTPKPPKPPKKRESFLQRVKEKTEKEGFFYKEKKRKRENRKRESFLQRVKEKTEKEGFFYKEKKRKQRKMITIEFFGGFGG
ncbi:MAG TPA: hypothetical protein PLC56_05690, partial [Candidatus Cloacimonas acidaminovorans]|nr:hypothetical protein [Candidatus Cloacimonas acidaminovorans]